MTTGRLPSVEGGIQPTIFDAAGDLLYAVSADTPARLPIGSTSQVLTVAGGVPTWAAPAGGGKVLQVVNAIYTTPASTTSTTYADTGLTASITPSSSSSKILVMITQTGSALTTATTGCAVLIKLLRNSTDLALARLELLAGRSSYNQALIQASNVITYLDSPATTSSTTYKTQFRSLTSGETSEVNGTGTNITLMEIGA